MWLLLMLADGAMGTELIARTGARSPAQLNLTQPRVVLALHREYAAAGAQLLVANTLMATPQAAAAGIRLARQAATDIWRASTAGGQVVPTTNSRELARPAARAADDGQLLVAGSLAAIPGRSRQSYEEQVRAMAGADLLLIETVTSLEALSIAIEAIEGLPIWATLAFDARGQVDGKSPVEVARELAKLPLAAFGYGCGCGSEAARPVLRELREAAPDAVLIAKPSTSLSPAAIAAWAQDTAAMGVQVIGACCGSTPAHIRSMSRALLDSDNS